MIADFFSQPIRTHGLDVLMKDVLVVRDFVFIYVEVNIKKTNC